MKQAPREMPSDAGFQIAPMIDVVFVIMLFFMVMAGAVKVEHELKTTLPGNAETAKETEMPDEITIGVAENGAITINGASKVLLANVGASNGVVHLINAVLLPPSVQKHLQLAMLA